jgi:hypothetical protein
VPLSPSETSFSAVRLPTEWEPASRRPPAGRTTNAWLVHLCLSPPCFSVTRRQGTPAAPRTGELCISGWIPRCTAESSRPKPSPSPFRRAHAGVPCRPEMVVDGLLAGLRPEPGQRHRRRHGQRLLLLIGPDVAGTEAHVQAHSSTRRLLPRCGRPTPRYASRPLTARSDPTRVGRGPIAVGSVASVEPGGEGRGWLRKLGGCVDLELAVPRSSGRRLPGSGSRRRCSRSRSAGTCATACPTGRWKSCWPSARSRSTT